MKIGKEFVKSVIDLLAGVPSQCIWNFDQSNFTYDHSNLRTLSIKGEKDTLMAVKSMNAATHSYSIMPLLAMDGTLASKLLICLQEKGGDFGPRVKKNLQVPKNIYVASSTSGKLQKGIMRNWIREYVSTTSPDNELALIYDSWAGQTDVEIYSPIRRLHSTYCIPPKTTQWVQPLDTYFFRQYKIVKRRICDRVLLDDIQIDLQKNIMFYSCIVLFITSFNQNFSSPCCSIHGTNVAIPKPEPVIL